MKLFNWFEKFILKRVMKKVVKLIPDLKEKGLEIIENSADEILEKIKEVIIQFIESHKNK